MFLTWDKNTFCFRAAKYVSTTQVLRAYMKTNIFFKTESVISTKPFTSALERVLEQNLSYKNESDMPEL